MSNHRMTQEQFKLKTYFKKYHSGLYQFMHLSENKIMNAPVIKNLKLFALL